MKRFLFLIIIGLATAGLFSLAQGEEVTAQGLEIIQSNGDVLVLENLPERVISLGPNITEAVYALGKGNLLVGRTDYCDFPAEVNEVATVGSISDPSLEQIILLEPDLVIASTHVKPEIMEKISEMNIPVLALYSDDSFDGVYNLLENMSVALGAEEQGKVIVNDMKETVNRVLKSVEGKEKPLVYYVIGYGEYGDYTAGGNTFIGQMLEMAGAQNAAADLEGWRYSLEELVKQDPDMLICSQYWGAKEGLMEAPGYRELSAVKEGRVYTIDNNKLDRQGPRLAEGLEDLANLINP